MKYYKDEDETDFDSDEIMGYQCNSCGNIQDSNNGFGCYVCGGHCLDEWYV